MRRAKHIDLKYHFVKSSTENGWTVPKEINSEDNPADGFTKPLMRVKFELFRDMIGVKLWKDQE